MSRTCTAAMLAALLLLVVGVPAVQAATVSSDGTTATFTGDSGDNVVSVESVDADTVRFIVDSGEIVEGANCTQAKVDTTDCEATARAVLDLGGGDDQLSGDDVTTHAMTADGGDGEDLVTGGALADDLRGGEGNDAVYGVRLLEPGTGGADRLDGGPDDDVLVQPAGGDDVVGGAGSDRLSLIVGDSTTLPVGTADLSVSLDDVANDMRAGEATNVHSDVEHVGNLFTDSAELGFYAFENDDVDEGRLTARGTAGPNSLTGGTDGDDLDGLAGNDVITAGAGDDRIGAVDGYADRVACGAGSDTVTADTLDDVSDSCENVERVDAGNANDAPGAPEDAPPTVALREGPTLTADAADDRGVSAVQFLDDDRLVCTDDSAPYTCDYAPRGEDVGRNTLIARAIDTAQQTATDVRAITVPKFAPASITVRARTRRVTGRVVLPAAVTPALGCKGTVAVKRGRGAAKRVRVKPDCTFSARVRLRPRSRVQAVFGGNEVLTQKRRSTRVR
ncbi:MAG TPA: Ig-like domain-containing protein [Solirubrobacteraceae bacterium]|jgi:hypothetical protein